MHFFYPTDKMSNLFTCDAEIFHNKMLFVMTFQFYQKNVEVVNEIFFTIQKWECIASLDTSYPFLGQKNIKILTYII